MGKIKRRSLERRMTFGKIVYRMVFLSFFGVVFYVLFLSGLLRINSIGLSGVENLDQDSILETVKASMDGKHLGIFEKSNLILFSGSRTEENLLGKFKRIEEVKISKKFPSGIDVSIEERKAVLVFCVNAKCHVLDQKGIAYCETTEESADAGMGELPVLTDQSAENINRGEEALSVGQLEFISSIANRLQNELDLKVSKNYETPTRISSDVRARTDEGWIIYFASDRDLSKEVAVLGAVLKKGIGEENRKDLEYVDLRSENRVYYKLKKSEEEQSEETADAGSLEQKKNSI